jgi:cytochrome c oxidase subunit 2
MTFPPFIARPRRLPASLAWRSRSWSRPAALAIPDWNLQTPVTPIARQMADLHLYIFWICVVIFVAVFGVMFYSLYKHRKSREHKAAHFHENTVVEIVWTVIPFLILLFMAFPATKTILAMKDTTAPGLTIKVTGNQWSWSYDYLQEGVSYISSLSTPIAQIENRSPKGEHYLLEVDNPLVVPVDTKVRVLLTASDVIHAWWVPALGVKQDAIPGFVRDTWFRAETVGVYRGQCAELCGKGHGFMPIVVEVKSKEDFAKWVDEQKARAPARRRSEQGVGLKDLVVTGETVYAANCAACHQANGKGVPGASRARRLEDRHGPEGAQIQIVLHGKPGTAMPPWTQLSDIDSPR